MKMRRSRTVRQMEFFQAPKVLPAWMELPREIQTEVSELILKMIREYAERFGQDSGVEMKGNDCAE
jgi:hypothetical protein